MTIDPVRAQALKRVQLKRGLLIHTLCYLLSNVIQVIVWWAYTPDLFFWPLWSILGWGVGLVIHFWAVNASGSAGEARVRQEMDRIQRREA